MDGWMDGWMDVWNGWMDGWKDGWMYGWMDGWMDGWMAAECGRMKTSTPCEPEPHLLRSVHWSQLIMRFPFERFERDN